MAQKRLENGCFVLLTNDPENGEDAYGGAEILAAYKDQHAVERNFSFLKDDAIVNALFLKTPKRIEALGFILFISPLIWRLMEREMRAFLEKEDQSLPG